MSFGQPNVEIDRKMANDQLLFLTLMIGNMHGGRLYHAVAIAKIV